MDGLDAILNVMRLSGRLASSGQPTAAQFADIAAAGFEAVINLAMPDSDGALADERAVVEALGKRRIWVHCALNWRVSAFLYRYRRHVLGLPAAEARRAMWPGWTPDAVWRAFMDDAG